MRRLCLTIAACALASPSIAGPLADAQHVRWSETFERLMAALKVDAQQISATGQQTQETWRKSSEANASTIAAQELALAEKAVREKYDFNTGQGVNACVVAAGREAVNQGDQAQSQLYRAWSDGDGRWIREGGDGENRMGMSLEMRMVAYCSPEERTAGICAGGVGQPFPAADSDASVWMLRRQNGLDDVMMAGDFADVVAPLPTVRKDPVVTSEALMNWDARRRAALLTAARRALVGVPISGMGGDGEGS